VSLRHALLAVLTAEPMTGYDLVKYFDGTVAFIWYAPHSQIYPELRRMERDGLVEARVVPRGQRSEKRLYSISPSGQRELARWINELLPLQPDRDPHRLKAAYIEFAEPDSARRQLTEHIRHYEQWLRRWQQLLTDIDQRRVGLLQRRLQASPPAKHQAIVSYKRFAFEGEVAKAEDEIAWAKRGLSLIDSLSEDIEKQDRRVGANSTDGKRPRVKGSRRAASGQ